MALCTVDLVRRRAIEKVKSRACELIRREVGNDCQSLPEQKGGATKERSGALPKPEEARRREIDHFGSKVRILNERDPSAPPDGRRQTKSEMFSFAKLALC